MSRFGFFAVRSMFVTSASNQTIADASSGAGRGSATGSKRDRAGEVVEPEVEPGAGLDQVPDLLVGLGAPERRVELDRHQLGDAQPERAAELTGDQLGERAPRLPWPAPRNLST